MHKNELLNIDVWLRCKKLSINVQKTNYVIFSPGQRKVNHSFSLSFGGQSLTQSNVAKFLGVYLDEHLTWKYHINFVCKQIAKSVGILSRTRFYFSCKTKLMLCYTLIYLYITYCNSTWSSTYVSELTYLQKGAVRAVTNSDHRAHTAPLFFQTEAFRAQTHAHIFMLIFLPFLRSNSLLKRLITLCLA